VKRCSTSLQLHKTPPYFLNLPDNPGDSFEMHVHWFTFYGEPDLKFNVPTEVLFEEGKIWLEFIFDPVTKHWESITIKNTMGDPLSQIDGFEETELKAPEPKQVTVKAPTDFMVAKNTQKGMGNAYANLF